MIVSMISQNYALSPFDMVDSSRKTVSTLRPLILVSTGLEVLISVFPQIAIAIGVLTSNRGEADEPLWRIGRGTRVPL